MPWQKQAFWCCNHFMFPEPDYAKANRQANAIALTVKSYNPRVFMPKKKEGKRKKKQGLTKIRGNQETVRNVVFMTRVIWYVSSSIIVSVIITRHGPAGKYHFALIRLASECEGCQPIVGIKHQTVACSVPCRFVGHDQDTFLQVMLTSLSRAPCLIDLVGATRLVVACGFWGEGCWSWAPASSGSSKTEQSSWQWPFLVVCRRLEFSV